MIEFNNRKFEYAQIVLEYVLVVGVIVVVLMTMNQLIKRSAQAIIKTAASQLGDQANADQTFSNKEGYLETSNTEVDFSNQKSVLERIGVINTTRTETETTRINTITNMGFTED